MYLNIKFKAVKFFYENIGYDLYKLQIRKRFLFFFFFFLLLFNYRHTHTQLYAFSPHTSTPPQVNPPPSPSSTYKGHMDKTKGEGGGKDFLDLLSRAQFIKHILLDWSSSKLIVSVLWKKMLRELSQITDWRNICKSYIW